MKTLYFTHGRNNIWCDKETDEAGRLENLSTYHIDGYYLIEEPMHIVYQYGDIREELDVKKGDILVKWDLGKDVKNHLTVVKSKGMLENFKHFIAEEQRRNEEWAKQQKGDDSCENCECGTCLA